MGREKKISEMLKSSAKLQGDLERRILAELSFGPTWALRLSRKVDAPLADVIAACKKSPQIQVDEYLTVLGQALPVKPKLYAIKRKSFFG